MVYRFFYINRTHETALSIDPANLAGVDEYTDCISAEG